MCIRDSLHIEAKEPDLTRWKKLVERCYHPLDEVSIAIVGKYVEYEDSYKSLKEALDVYKRQWLLRSGYFPS